MRVRSIAPPQAASARDPLATAAGIGERLAREAVWHRGRCNWLGAFAGVDGGPPVDRALGPDLGSGTAGVALFLAELHAATGDPAARRTALGAAAQALAHCAQAAPPCLYGGRHGIASATARCGVLLGEERLVRGAERLARARGGERAAAAASDLAHGAAGSIAALLALASLLGDDGALARAVALGDELAAAARRGREGWSWPAPGGARHDHGLCGLAHGASAAAWTLLELFAAAAEPRHRAAALGAMDYERHWLDAGAGTWPDLRGVRRSEPRGSFAPAFAPTWRHGAPGIALARLRAHRILGDERCRAEAALALAATAAHAERELLEPRADFTLATGLAGCADALLVGGEPAQVALARRIGDSGAGRHAGQLDGWPGPLPGRRTTGLLDGDAGIGLLYLRLGDPALASPLLPGAPAG